MDPKFNMSTNSTTSPSGTLGFMIQDLKESPGKYLTLFGVLLTAILLNKLSTPSLDAHEPPLLKPRFPIVGHFYGIMKHQNIYLKQL